MNFDDLKDKLKESAAQIWSRIQESSFYIQLQEKYTDQNPGTQRAMLFGGVALAILLVLAIPMIYLTSASDNVAAFEEKKQLLRELYRVGRASSELEAAPPSVDSSTLVSQAQNVLQTAQIPPELVKGVREFDNATPQPGVRALPNVPKAVKQNGVEVALSKMNLRQVVDLGYKLQAMTRGLKMVGLTVDADVSNPHYYDVVYQLISFSLPVDAEPAAAKTGKGVKGKKSPPSKKKSKDDEDKDGEGA